MKTYSFFLFDKSSNPPNIKVFPISFDDSGAMVIDQNDIPQGMYILEADGKILERISPEEEFEIPVVYTLEDPNIRIFDKANHVCVASPNAHLIGVIAYFFEHGFNAAIAKIKINIQEMQQNLKRS